MIATRLTHLVKLFCIELMIFHSCWWAEPCSSRVKTPNLDVLCTSPTYGCVPKKDFYSPILHCRLVSSLEIILEEKVTKTTLTLRSGWFWLSVLPILIFTNIAKVSKAHIPPAVAIRGHTTLRQNADYRKKYTSSHQMNIHVYCLLLQR